ncbi:long-chain fatty acid--CoA ligase [Amycolatopsis sp. NBC_00345]|uniref:long-chain-fatty-acid--CoA ligase n=1 Tax=Amycolatopsis sp. NBC_00345 TaxID=2975955 RepID=UPI002E264E84
MTTIAQALTRGAARHPERIAVTLDDHELSYRALDEASARVAALLRARGVRPGDRVGIMLPNVPFFAAAYFGVLRAGAIAVPMNILLKPREVAYYLADSQAALLFAWHEADTGAPGTDCVEVGPDAWETLLAGFGPVDGVVERDGTGTAVILYTSGTTGRPKGAELTHDNLRPNTDAAIELMSLDQDSVVLGALPLFHVFGLTCGLNATITAGAKLTLVPRFAPAAVLGVVARDRVTCFQGVPTMYSALLAVPDRERYDVSSLDVCVSGGSALPGEVLRRFEQTFGCPILEGYGLSETSPIASFNFSDRRKAGSIGTPIAGVRMRIVDDAGADVPPGEPGEIVISGHNVMKGYWNKPAETAASIRDGWFHSGDIGRIDEDGYFFIVDRKKDLIIRGGYNVYPREIEEVLYERPAVQEAAVVGVEHAELGEEVGAAVALKAGTRVTADELREFVKDQVAAYKYPRVIWFVDRLPKGATGKILKRAIEKPATVPS